MNLTQTVSKAEALYQLFQLLPDDRYHSFQIWSSAHQLNDEHWVGFPYSMYKRTTETYL